MNFHLLHNAHIYTLNPELPRATAMAWCSSEEPGSRRGEILAVGDEATARGAVNHFDAVHDLQGRVVIPGLIDAHIHLEQLARVRQQVDCETATRAHCLQRVAERARSARPGDWIYGHGWTSAEWPEGLGTARQLDEVAPQNPVFLTAKSLHAAWVNKAALQAAGIHAQTSDPPGGRIERDDQGEPSGILYEEAIGLIRRVVPEIAVGGVAESIAETIPELIRLGLTGVHDFDRRRCFSALQSLREENRLGLRVIKSIPVDDLESAVRIGLRTGFGDELLRVGSVKAFADGALGPQTAAMFEPYHGDPENRGMLLLDEEELFEYGQLAASKGLSMAIHAIGDRANHAVLSAYRQLRQYEGTHRLPRRRHRIEHVQILHPDDFGLLAELNIIASMQPIHATSDMVAADRYWGERSKNSYAWRALQAQGTAMAFGSDAPVESPNPFWGLHAAVTRRRLDGSPGPEGWHPEQRLDVETGLQAYTVGAAYAAGMEARLGRLRTGYLADLVVLETDLFECEPDSIKDIRPVGVLIGGQWEFSELDS